MCRAAEKASDLSDGSFDANMKPELALTASVSFNPEDGRFVFDKSFFDIVKLEDKAREEF